MRVPRWPVLFLVVLLVLTPFVFAGTYEAWDDGLYDAESDDGLQAAKCPEAAIERAPLVVAPYVPVVATVALGGDGSAAPAVVEPAPPCRAPPCS
jgi:hypothetical protein